MTAAPDIFDVGLLASQPDQDVLKANSCLVDGGEQFVMPVAENV
jgi:hypothetical protein